MKPTNPTWIKETLRNSNLSPQKKFGQNFLRDEQVVTTMFTAAQLTKIDTVVEIGPGLGALTLQMSPLVQRIIAVEYDKHMAAILNKNLVMEEIDNIAILNQDILDFNPERYQLLTTKYKLIGSLPYQITSPLMHKLIAWKVKPSVAVFLVQKEVAEKLTTKAPKASYFSHLLQPFCTIEIVKIVKPESFFPPPKVNSAVIKLIFHSNELDLDIAAWSKFLHKGFKNQRKMINKTFDPQALQKLGINPQNRPANLQFEEWMKLYKQEKSLSE